MSQIPSKICSQVQKSVSVPSGGPLAVLPLLLPGHSTVPGGPVQLQDARPGDWGWHQAAQVWTVNTNIDFISKHHWTLSIRISDNMSAVWDYRDAGLNIDQVQHIVDQVELLQCWIH